MSDAILTKEGNTGAAVYRTKLTEANVRAILRSEASCAHIAAQYGVSDVTISQIKRGIIWKHVPRPPGYRYVPHSNGVG